MASGTRGYSSYRGRGRKGKVLLAILLLLVIAASVGFIIARENMAYDTDGALHFQLPWAQKETPPAEVVPDDDVTIQTPEPSMPKAAGRSVALESTPLTEADWASATLVLDILECPSAAVTLKDERGWVYFDSASALSGTVRFHETENGAALSALLEETRQREGRAIARIACFHDPKAANADVEGMGLKNTGGFIFYDGNNSQWLDPGKDSARAYLVKLIREAAELGFDEILLMNVGYPTEGKLDKIAYTYPLPGTAAEKGRQENLALFLRQVREELPESVTLSLELDADTVCTGRDENAGQNLSVLAPLVDFIYAPATEAEIPALQTAVETAAQTCGFVPELTEVPAGALENWMLLPS